MTAEHDGEHARRGAHATASRLDHLLAHLDDVDLATVDAAASLQYRFDTKYLLTDEVALAMVGRLGHGWRVLEVEGLRIAHYRSHYFDDPARSAFRDHIKGRRHRHKVRVRQYSTSGPDMLEVKLKTDRGQTDKRRRPREEERSPLVLTSSERTWLHEVLDATAAPGMVDRLEPTVRIGYQRATLWHEISGERVTIDCDVSVSRATAGAEGTGSHERPLLARGVVLEVKSAAPRSATSRLLLALRCRPDSFSKYCAGLAATTPGLDDRLLVGARRALARQSRM